MRLLVLWMMLIFALSSLPDLDLTQLQHWLDKPHRFFIDLRDVDWNLLLSWNNPYFSIPTQAELDLYLHKIGHIIAYSTLGLLAFRCTRSIQQSFWICLLFAFSDELHQAFVPGRGSRLYDVILDTTVSMVLVYAAYWFMRPGRSRSKKKKPALNCS